MDFGLTWGASHSLIQSVTFDENYFWTAALSDAYPMGIKVEYTSKRDLNKNIGSYDSINKKYNLRIYGTNDSLAGYIRGYKNGRADGKLGGILYFEKFNIYCIIYAKTPNVRDENQGKNIIYLTTWKFENETITNIKTIEVKVFESGNIMQVRAGRYGDDKVFITYSNITNPRDYRYGFIEMGTIPYFYIIDISTLKILKKDIKLDKLIMNTNEDLKTFYDGVLIWASTNKEKKLVINKIGTPLLNEKYDDINYILTKDDLIEEKEKEIDENNTFLSTGVKVAIIIAVIIVALLLIFGIYMILRYLCSKKVNEDINSLPQNKLTD